MRHTIVLGQTDRMALLEALHLSGARTNPYFDVLWPQVTVASEPSALDVVIATAADLGMPDGTTLDALIERAAPLGLGPCPLEAAVRLRLVLDEPPGFGRVTVVSRRVIPEEDAPRGFYLRRDDEGVWLRAFVASDDWCFEGSERFALASLTEGTCAR